MKPFSAPGVETVGSDDKFENGKILGVLEAIEAQGYIRCYCEHT